MPKYEMSAQEYKDAASGAMLETPFRDSVREMAHFYGWEILLEIPDRAYMELVNALMPYNPVLKRRVPVSRSALNTLHAIKAWPDMFIGHRGMGTAIALELKTAKGRVDPQQKKKIQLLNDSGITAGVWRPRDLDTLDGVLQGNTHGGG